MYDYNAIVTKVYDADTITVNIDLGFGIWLKKQSIRLLGVDAPEIRGEERPEGLKSKEQLLKWIPVGSEILLKTNKDKKGKYGRWLGTILLQDIASKELVNINELLIYKGFAKVYE